VIVGIQVLADYHTTTSFNSSSSCTGSVTDFVSEYQQMGQ
jgi:hypothetical protein